MSDPTERSIPPVTITGVSARASRPISVPRRTISKAFLAVQKLRPITEKTATSATRRSASTPSWERTMRRSRGFESVGKAWANIPSLPQINRIGCHGDQDN